MNSIKILFVGDVVGSTGRAVVGRHLGAIQEKHKIDVTILNGENSSNQGRGITPQIVQYYLDLGVNVITTGNHIWFRKDIYSTLNESKELLRPANFPSGAPGIGVTTVTVNGITVGVMNLQGRIFMKDLVECPLKAADSILSYLKDKTSIVCVDFHAEATSEKEGLAFYLDGRVSAVVGTHTHVQTADERVLPNGTAYITDLGMAGSLNSMLGMQKEPIIQHFLTQVPVRFTVDEAPPYVLSGVVVEVDVESGKALRIDRIRIVDEQPLEGAL